MPGLSSWTRYNGLILKCRNGFVMRSGQWPRAKWIRLFLSTITVPEDIWIVYPSWWKKPEVKYIWKIFLSAIRPYLQKKSWGMNHRNGWDWWWRRRMWPNWNVSQTVNGLRCTSSVKPPEIWSLLLRMQKLMRLRSIWNWKICSVILLRRLWRIRPLKKNMPIWNTPPINWKNIWSKCYK